MTTEISQKNGRSLGERKKIVNPLSKSYVSMLVNENEAVKRYKFRMNRPKGYSGNIGENYNRTIIFLLPATILILLREFTLPPLSVQVGPNAVTKRALTRAT